ncbi:hypothetical protein [Devosia sp.]|uniref:hypothetical protein n=1 Tax=Devosia sp. TaxID=1871048 RepID=UPI003BAAF7DA
MKIRSLLLGSVAAAGLSTGAAYAADLGVLTSLDVCDNLGLSGLTISSDTNCLQITGEVKYKFSWGDYKTSGYEISHIHTPDDLTTFNNDNGGNDWESRFDAWIKFVATASSDFGPAKAVIKLLEKDNSRVSGASYASGVSYTYITTTGLSGGTSGTVTYSTSSSSAAYASGVSYATYSGSDTDGVVLDEAYVSIGDSTVISAGKKGSIMNKGDDEPLNWLGLFNSENVDAGVGWTPDLIGDGGHVIQIETDLGNGLSAKAGLENLNGGASDTTGTAVGVLAYSGDGLSAHITVAANGVLAGEIQDWGVHAGFTGTFDNFKIVAAGAFDSTDYWNVLASASATFDMFTIAASVEAADGTSGGGDDYYGAGASITAAVADGVTLNVGGRWAHDSWGDNSYEVAAAVAASVTENLTLTGTVGYVNTNDETGSDLFYGSAKLAWAPGGDAFTSSVKGTINSEGGYKIESEFKKTFQ